MSVWITACLCPRRHCIMSAVFDERDRAPSDGNRLLEQELEKVFEEGVINRRCGICYATEFTYETARTRFATMEEAAPELLLEAVKNIATGLQIGEIGGEKLGGRA